jgi:hypothetical protein
MGIAGGRVKGVRRDENDALIRLADAICGSVPCRIGADLLTLQRLLRHDDPPVPKRYAKQTIDDLRAVHAATSPVDRGDVGCRKNADCGKRGSDIHYNSFYTQPHTITTSCTMTDLHRQQIESNYEAFQKELPNLIQTHRGKFALMHDGKIVEFFDTARDAFVAGQKLFEDKLFSVQEVVDTPVDLGFFSHALP